MNPVALVKEITTLSIATVVLKTSTRSYNRADRKLDQANQLIKSGDYTAKRVIYLGDVAMAHVRAGDCLQKLALKIHKPIN